MAYTICHPTDLNPDDAIPFAHAVALASSSGAALVAIHAQGPGQAPQGSLDAGTLLEKWGRSAVPFEMVNHVCCDDPVDTTLDAMRSRTIHLVVVGTHHKSALAQTLQGSFSEAIARETHLPTLFVPVDGPGIVGEDGAVLVRRILVPCGGSVDVRPAIREAIDFARRADLPPGELHLLHVGDDRFPDLGGFDAQGWEVHKVTRPGRLEDAVAAYCAEAAVDLLVMGTQGHTGVLDFLRGSHTERVTRKVERPVLSVSLPA